jgi:hypothetical protein
LTEPHETIEFFSVFIIRALASIVSAQETAKSGSAAMLKAIRVIAYGGSTFSRGLAAPGTMS